MAGLVAALDERPRLAWPASSPRWPSTRGGRAWHERPRPVAVLDERSRWSSLCAPRRPASRATEILPPPA
jgi:hypothetical protein